MCFKCTMDLLLFNDRILFLDWDPMVFITATWRPMNLLLLIHSNLASNATLQNWRSFITQYQWSFSIILYVHHKVFLIEHRKNHISFISDNLSFLSLAFFLRSSFQLLSANVCYSIHSLDRNPHYHSCHFYAHRRNPLCQYTGEIDLSLIIF